jgi:hypothetical protein
VSGESPPTRLIRPAGDVAGGLDRSIAQGRDLLAELQLSSLPVPERLEQFGARYWDWHDANAALLARAFSTNEIAQSYEEIAVEKSVGQLGLADLLRDLVLGLQRDVVFLVRLHERLRAFDVPPPQ